MIKLKNRDALISKLKPLEAKGKVKINYDTGEVELLGKSEEENKAILSKFMYSDPRTCLNVLTQLDRKE
jgi:hypothetical protein